MLTTLVANKFPRLPTLSTLFCIIIVVNEFQIIKSRIMKIEYNNLYTHFVFTVLNRQPLIEEKHRERIEKYLTGIINKLGSQLYAIYANPEHVHFLVSRSPSVSEETLATKVANSSENFINENRLCAQPFNWQQSASAFSVSKAEVDKVCKYILGQPEHHRKTTFTEEYEIFLHHYQAAINKK
jgi:REP element-mobilizing transposase RayT